ncbi:MAG: 2-C-methyl-D-erythritol 2,4-cyclodiphosphate synthase [Lachnospiraceae bacterium]|nr:2-C-methyl-D-erythritol 2,4-cyclodiphosphate synthase [Lachnospiraceae bacterium]
MYRIGEGYDVHKLVPDRDLILGGVKIPYEKGLLGHSDADVLLHSVMDSLLGACALGDIGKYFPDSDEQYRNISSLKLLNNTLRIINESISSGKIKDVDKFTICNIDSTIICQKPKLRDYIDEMRKNIADALNIDLNQVSIKATTEEGLGFTGSGEGIAVRSITLIELYK